MNTTDLPAASERELKTPSRRHLQRVVSLRVPEDATERFWMRVSRLKEAECPNTGAYLRCSRGSRRAGRKRRWWAVLDDKIVRFTADSIEEAIEKAHRRLNAQTNAKLNDTGGEERKEDLRHG